MATETYSRLDLAERQLKMAVDIFLAGGDRFSVITLAGASDVIMCQLLLRQGKENFTDISRREEEKKTGQTISRSEHGREINDLLFINALKHMDKEDHEFLELDVERCAGGAILKGLANYVELKGRSEPFVEAFLQWVKDNLDPRYYNVDCDPNWEPPDAD